MASQFNLWDAKMGTRAKLFGWLLIIFVAGLGLGFIAPRLLAGLFDFIELKTNLIQGLADFIQIGIWLATLIWVWLTWARGSKKPAPGHDHCFQRSKPRHQHADLYRAADRQRPTRG